MTEASASEEAPPSSLEEVAEPSTSGPKAGTAGVDRGTSAGLEKAVSEGPRPARLVGRSRRTSRRRVWIALSLVVVLAISAAGLWWVMRPTAAPSSYQGVVRTYYIASVEVEWNYTPLGVNGLTGLSLGASPLTDLYWAHNATYLGTTFLKCIYQGFTDGSFTTLLPRTPGEQYLGLLGPTIYAEVGDTVVVHYRNDCRFPESMHPQGLGYSPSDSGIPYNGSVSSGIGGSVPPGDEFNYTWSVPSSAGPGPQDRSSVLWGYYSGASPLNSSDTGLMGPIIVTAAGEGNDQGAPANVAESVVLCLTTIDEGNSPYLGQNILNNAQDPGQVNPNDPTWQQSLNKYAINGYTWGNSPTIDLTYGENVRWYVMSFGNDFHPVNWQGNPVLWGTVDTDTIPLYPGATAVADMQTWANGTWIVGSDSENDLAGGMQALYNVSGSPSQTAEAGPSPASATVSSGGGSSSVGSLGLISELVRAAGSLGMLCVASPLSGPTGRGRR